MQTYLVTTTKKNYLKITGNLTKNTSANDLNIMLSVFRFHQHKMKFGQRFIIIFEKL